MTPDRSEAGPARDAAGSRAVTDPVLRRIERFLYREALLLDERRFDEWVELFTDDVHYWMPVRRDKSPRADIGEFAGPGELAFFDETKDTLMRRVAKLRTGVAWAEEPPSRTRHLITNVDAEQADAAGEILVYSNFIAYRTRLETKQDLFVGRREDVLRPHGGSWKIARRKILLDMTVLFADNLSIFF
jgi:biphenyl 2,3-dioxygenase beta subunit